ncbi:MAG: PPC domain-containing protein [Elainellaceae cyanobacterium]
MPRKAFDRFDAAKNVGKIRRQKSLKGVITPSDRVDFFEMRLTNRSSFSILPKRVKSTLKIKLFNSDESSLGRIRFKKGQKGKSLERDLKSGTYYVQVQGRVKSGNSRYKLKLGAQRLPEEPGENMATAFNIGQISGTQQYSEFVGTNDPSDFYKFTVAQNSNLEVRFASPSAQTEVDLIADLNNNGLIDSGEGINGRYGSSGAFFEPLAAGTYFLKINPRFSSTSTQYDLTVVI